MQIIEEWCSEFRNVIYTILQGGEGLIWKDSIYPTLPAANSERPRNPLLFQKAGDSISADILLILSLICQWSLLESS